MRQIKYKEINGKKVPVFVDYDQTNTLFEFTPAKAIKDTFQAVFGWIPLVSGLFGKSNSDSIFEGHEFPAIYVPGQNQLRFFLKAIENNNPNLVLFVG